MTNSRTPALAAAVAEAFSRGRIAWPGSGISEPQFAGHVTSLDVDRAALLEHGSDLYLACGCALGDAASLDDFGQQILSRVGIFVARFDLAPHQVDEVRQRVGMKLLVGAKPGIARYRGQGPLRAWIRVTAVRVAIDVIGSGGIDHAVDGALLDVLVSTDENPELAAARNLHRQQLQTSLEAALHALEAREKTLLRLYVVDGLNIEAIGAIYCVHRATIARWLVAIRGKILEGVRRTLAVRASVSPSELRSLAGLLQSEIRLSARRILAADDGP